jgi:uracil-DNA glycosylase family 4
VTAWHATPLAGRRVFRLSYASHKAAGISKCNVQLTGDHPVMTDRGWVAVQDLRQGDRIATGQGLSETAFDVICGTLLGDGHIETSSARFSLGHSERQSEYLHLKAELLAELDCHVDSLAVAARAGATRRYQALHLRTKAHRALAILRSQFYAAKKRVPSWMETRLNDRMLAFWFMDDGYMRIRTNRQPRAEIATCAFSEQDIQRLLHGLANLGIPAKALRGRIHLDVQATRKLSERIAPFVPPMMRHKLHPDVARSIPYDPERLIVGTAQVLYDEAEATEIIHSGTDQTFYCLDIEDTHNFVTSGGVVHNCRPPGNRNPEPGEALQCEPYLHRQIELIRPKLIVALGKVAAANLLATDASVASMRGKVHRYRDTPLIVTYHPAYLLRNLPDKAKAWADLCFAVRVMRDLQGGGGAPN